MQPESAQLSAKLFGGVEGWLQAARDGSGEAMGHLFELFRPHLILFAQHQLSPVLRTKGDASDLVQDAFLSAHCHFNEFKGSSLGELRAWLRRIVLNRVLNFTRDHYGTGKRRLIREVSLDANSRLQHLLISRTLPPSAGPPGGTSCGSRANPSALAEALPCGDLAPPP
jgi:hypothetical protein